MKLPDSWFTSVAEDHNSQTVIVCGRDNLTPFKTSGKFKERIEITWEYAESGMPNDDTAKLMEEAGEAVRLAVEKNKLAINTGIYTGGGKRVWVFYSRHIGAFGEELNSALAEFELLPISIYTEKDPDWNEYNDILETRVADDGEMF